MVGGQRIPPPPPTHHKKIEGSVRGLLDTKYFRQSSLFAIFWKCVCKCITTQNGMNIEVIININKSLLGRRPDSDTVKGFDIIQFFLPANNRCLILLVHTLRRKFIRYLLAQLSITNISIIKNLFV